MKPTILTISKRSVYDNVKTTNHIGFSFKNETNDVGKQQYFKIFSRTKCGVMKQLTNNQVRAGNCMYVGKLNCIVYENKTTLKELNNYLHRYVGLNQLEITRIVNELKDGGFVFVDDVKEAELAQEHDPSKGGFVIMVEKDGILAPSSTPKVHKTESLAMEELSRLSRLHTGQNFYMMKIVKCANVPPAPTVTIKTF
jgi:hypothetical protein